MKSGTESTASNTLADMLFSNCPSLKTILNWPTNIFSVSQAAFDNCGFENLTLPQEMVALDERAFQSCSKLHTVTIPKTMTRIGPRAFANCEQLKNIIFEDGSTLDQLDALAISNCIQLETVTLPDSLTIIDNSCFLGDIMLTKITFSKNSGIYTSYNTAVYRKDSDITHYTFYICPPGTSTISLHPETHVIVTYAFYSCNNLLHVDLSGLVEKLEERSFSDCASIKSIRLPGTVQHVESRALSSCPNLEMIFYCSSKNNIECGDEPFPADSKIYVFRDFPDQTFHGYSCYAILDHQCNIPTNLFTQPRFTGRPQHTVHVHVSACLCYMVM